MKRWKYSLIGTVAVLIALPTFPTDPGLFFLIAFLALAAGLLLGGKWLGR